MTTKTLKRMVCLLFLPIALTACKEKTEIAEEVRAIKTMVVSEMATEQILKFSGSVAATDSSGLSFQVGGQVESVYVDIGDSVTKGQVLAVLDPETYQLDVDANSAGLEKARDDVKKSAAEYERQKRIFEQGAGSKRSLDVAEYQYKSAKSAVDFHIAKLNQAKSNLTKTKLFSPYDGTIAWRSVQPSEKVQAGQKVLEINATGGLEVQLAIPETSIDLIQLEDAVTITFPTLSGQSTRGHITYIGSAAAEANAFPVKVALVNPDQKIKPGMSAEATVVVSDANWQSGFTIPLQALLPAEEENQAYVFVYDPRSSTIKETKVRFNGMENKKAIVEEGLTAGDTIAVAGVSFLADGMTVKLMQE
jgi:multidrug efflux system membrane fusion protein